MEVAGQNLDFDGVYGAGSEEYERLQQPFSQFDWIPADYVAEPKTTEQLSDLVRQAANRRMRIRFWTGHMLPDSPQAGLHIGGYQLKHLEYDGTTGIVTVGAGTKQPELDRFLIERGRAAVTSTFSSNSVIGVALVGGYGWLSAMHGSSLNNMVAAKVVLADGRIVTCSEEERPELFFAIRGSGGSLGIVAEASFHTHPQKQDVFWGTLTMPIKELESTLDLLRKVEENLDSKAMISARIEHSPTTTQIAVRLFFNGTEAEARTQFAPLLAMENAEIDASMVRFDEVSEQMGRLPDHQSGSRYAYTGVNLRTFDGPDVAQICRDFMNQIESLEGIHYAVLGFDTRNFPTTVADSKGCGANASKIMTYMRIQWLDPTHDTDVESMIKELGNSWRSKVVLGQKGYPPFCRTGDLKSEEIYGRNLQRLRDLKAQYDPHSMWVDRSILAA